MALPSRWERDYFNGLIRLRASLLSDIRDGEFDHARERLAAVQTFLADAPAFSERPESIPVLTQIVGLLGDAAVLNIANGNTELAQEYLMSMSDTQARLGKLIEPLTALGANRCKHGRATLSPTGDCQFSPPCP